MISLVVALLLPVAADNSAKVSRDVYSKCIKEFVRTSAEKKLDAPGFAAAFNGVCRDQEAAFKKAMVTSEVALGIKRAISEKGVADEVNDYRAMAKEDFEAQLASAPKP